MKISVFLIRMLLIISICCLPTVAEDYTQFSLPEGAKARYGKGKLGEVRFSPNGNQLAVSTSVGIWFYDPDTGKVLDLLPQTNCASTFAFAYSPDGKTIIRATDDSKTQLWDVATKQRIGTLTKYGRKMTAIAYSPDGTTIITGNSDGGARVCDTETLQRRGTLRGHKGSVNAVVYSPDGTIIATGSGWSYRLAGKKEKDDTIRLWDAKTGEHIATFTGHRDGVNALAFSPDSKTLASASADDTVRLWNLNTGETKATLTGRTGNVNAVIYAPDGDTLASSASSDETVRLWDAKTGEHIATFTGHKANVNSLAFSPDSKTLASTSADDTVRLWNLNTGETNVTISGHTRRDSVVYAPDGEGLRLWVARSAKGKNTSPDGKTIATLGSTHTVQLLDAQTGKRKATLRHTNPFDWIYMMMTDREYDVEVVAFSPDGNTIATGGGYYTHDEGTVHLWHIRTRRRKVIYKGRGYISSVTFSPDGKTIAVGDWESRILLLNAVTGEQLQTIRTGHKGGVLSLTYSPDGNTIATGGGHDDNTVRLFNADTGKLKTTFKGQAGGVSSIAYSPDGNTIATGHWNGKVQLWDATTGQHKTTFTGHTGVTSVVYFRDGHTIASGNKDGTVLLWEVPLTSKDE